MQIQQLQVSFDAREDRLLLRISTVEREEILVWLTRRLIKALWPYLRKMVDGHMGGKAAPMPIVSTAAPSDANPPANLDAGSFSEPYQDDDLSHPLGADPLLAMESRLQPIDGPGCRITLGEIKGRKVSFECDKPLMDAFCAMVRATVAKGDWDLDLDALRPAEASESNDATPDTAHTLH